MYPSWIVPDFGRIDGEWWISRETRIDIRDIVWVQWHADAIEYALRGRRAVFHQQIWTNGLGERYALRPPIRLVNQLSDKIAEYRTRTTQ